MYLQIKRIKLSGTEIQTDFSNQDKITDLALTGKKKKEHAKLWILLC